VKHGLDSQRAVHDAVAVCRKIDRHFSQSCLAKEKLQEIQVGIPRTEAKSIIKNVSTRWNSTYYIDEKILEQKKALVTYSADHDIVLPTKNQLVAVLGTVEQVTCEISSDASSAADVIPIIKLLTMSLECFQDDAGIQTMKSEIIHDIKTRFDKVEQEHLYVTATLVDPRYV